jgi:hypothetical protein
MKSKVKGKGESARAVLRPQSKTGAEDRSTLARECTVNSYGTTPLQNTTHSLLVGGGDARSLKPGLPTLWAHWFTMAATFTVHIPMNTGSKLQGAYRRLLHL